MSTVEDLISELVKLPPNAPVVLDGGLMIEVNAINPTDPKTCVVWINPFGTRLLTEALHYTNTHD